MQLLAIEIGLSTVKAVVLDAVTAERLGAIAEMPFELRHPTPEAVEVPAEDVWSAVTVAARRACRDFPGVEGIGLVVAAPFLVLLDKADQPLAPMRTPLDRRARPAARQVWAAVGD
jgi:sugar (pentulose or hexulose) kinase